MINKIKENFLPIGVIIFSLISLTSSIPMQNYLSIIISLIGILAGVLYLKNGKSNNHLIEIWLIAQIPYIDRIIFATNDKPSYKDPIYDVSQAVCQALYMHFSWVDKMVLIGFNFLPLIVIAFLMYFKIPYQKNNF